MQVSATLIAAQQAAREAQARFQAIHIAPPPAGFTAALEKTAVPGTESFSPLPLKQAVAAPQPASAPQTPAASPAARLGTMVDIRI